MTKVRLSLHLDGIDELHRERVQRINSLLAMLEAPRLKELGLNAQGYAVAHHFLEGAEAAGNQSDFVTLGWYCAKSEADLQGFQVAASGIHALAVSIARPNLLTSQSMGAPYCLLGPDSPGINDTTHSLLTSAFDMAKDAGFDDLLTRHGAVICVVDDAEKRDPRTWTVSRLPGTIFVLRTDPVLMAQDLIHEAGHSWLTDALVAYKVAMQPDRVFYSPWRLAPRPMFGFLHACWAFPLTAVFMSSLLGGVYGEVRRTFETYIEEQQELMRSARDDFFSAVECLSNDVVASRLVEMYEAASAL